MESMVEAEPEPQPPPPPLADLILSLEQATHMAKQLPTISDPTYVLHIYSSLHQAHHHLSNFLSTPQFPQLQPQNSLSSATGNEPMQVGDGEDDDFDDGVGEGNSRAATIDMVEEQMRDCFIKNKRPKRRLSPSAAAVVEDRRLNGDGFVGSVKGFDPHESKLRALELVYQFHGICSVMSIEKDAPLSLVIDIIIEQGLFQSRYEIQAFRLESTAHGTGAPVDELQFEGVSSHSDLRKYPWKMMIMTRLHFSLRPPQISLLLLLTLVKTVFSLQHSRIDKILHEMKEKVGLENGASSRIDVPDYGEEKNKVSNSSYNVNVTYGFRLLNGTNNKIPTASYVVAELRQIGGGDHDVGLFGIFDGVMNYQTPAYLQSYLFKNIIAEPEFWLSTAYAVRRGYLITNNNLVERDLR
ncbi:hypothetical protein GBA52_007543 [Prunus armeniaca]|nr:hypothetical protein GBA52_007543 [Prunus armeniaca]